MFSNTAKGAEASAVLYSLIETAKSNGLIPFDYLHHILKELEEGKTSTEDLLPWNVSL
jgi:transposase